jgi:septum formation protein
MKGNTDIINPLSRLILASASPRRAELLRAAGFQFEVQASDVDETPAAGESPREYTLRVARDKARHVAALGSSAGAVVLAADTEVVADCRILGKPRDPAHAASILRLLSGAAHEVLTAVVVKVGDREVADVVTTVVHVAPLTDEDINWYVASGEPMGKAGAYGIQGRAARFIERIDGSWSAVVGLPVATVHRLLRGVE